MKRKDSDTRGGINVVNLCKLVLLRRMIRDKKNVVWQRTWNTGESGLRQLHSTVIHTTMWYSHASHTGLNVIRVWWSHTWRCDTRLMVTHTTVWYSSDDHTHHNVIFVCQSHRPQSDTRLKNIPQCDTRVTHIPQSDTRLMVTHTTKLHSSDGHTGHKVILFWWSQVPRSDIRVLVTQDTKTYSSEGDS